MTKRRPIHKRKPTDSRKPWERRDGVADGVAKKPVRAKRPPMSRISRQLSQAGLALKKGLGQNFLVNQRALEKIAASVPSDAESVVIEIGCGLGNLTELLAERAHMVLAVELDERFRELHAEALGDKGNIQILYGDFMEVDLPDILQPFKGRPIHIVGNIPYHLTSPILFKIAQSSVDFASACILMQREVAERMSTGDDKQRHGILAVKMAVRFDVERVFTIAPGSFLPPPKVHSALVRMTSREHGWLVDNVEEMLAFFNYVDAAFAQRRKMLAKSLAAGSKGAIGREAAEAAMERLGIDLKSRAEALLPEAHLALFRELGRPAVPSVRATYAS